MSCISMVEVEDNVERDKRMSCERVGSEEKIRGRPVVGEKVLLYTGNVAGLAVVVSISPDRP